MHFKLFTPLFAVFLAVNISGAQGHSTDKNPNILLILVDDLGYGDLSCQGATDLQTPNIDAIAKNGLTFNNFFSK